MTKKDNNNNHRLTTDKEERIQVRKNGVVAPSPTSPETLQTTQQTPDGILVTDTTTGVGILYISEDEGERNQSLSAIDNHFDSIDRAKKNAGKSKQDPYTKLMHAKTMEILESGDYQHSYISILCAVTASAKYGGRIPLSKEQVAEKLKLGIRTVQRAWAFLIQKGVIYKGVHEGREAYFLSPDVAQRGTSKIKETEEMSRRIRHTATGKLIKLVDGGRL